MRERDEDAQDSACVDLSVLSVELEDILVEAIAGQVYIGKSKV